MLKTEWRLCSAQPKKPESLCRGDLRVFICLHFRAPNGTLGIWHLAFSAWASLSGSWGDCGEMESSRAGNETSLGSNCSSSTYLLAMKSKQITQPGHIVSAPNVNNPFSPSASKRAARTQGLDGEGTWEGPAEYGA